jgi:hypothetical protein
MANNPKSNITSKDITGEKYNTNIKEEAAKLRLALANGENLSRYQKAVLEADATIQRMNKPKGTQTNHAVTSTDRKTGRAN